MRVIVIGAGIIGCATAYELARRGAHVTVIDMRRPGEGATNASAGVLAPFIESHSPEFLSLAIASLSMYDTFVARVRNATGYDVGYARTGSVEIALNEAQWDRLRQRAAAYSSASTEHRLLESSELRALEPAIAADAAGGIFVPAHGHVAVRPLIAALAEMTARCGGTLIADCHVDRVTGGGSEIRVEGTNATFAADTVVLAAGSWSGQVAIERTPAAAVKPIRGQLLQLTCPSPPSARVLWGADCYLVPWQDGTLLAGATTEDVGFDERATVAGVRDLLEATCELLPSAWSARFQEVRVGLRPSTEDGLPIVGRASSLPNVVYATGHYRNGVLLAPFTAWAVADLVLENRSQPELALTRPSRFGL